MEASNIVVIDELKVALAGILPWFVFWHVMYRAFQVCSPLVPLMLYLQVQYYIISTYRICCIFIRKFLSPRLWPATYPSRLTPSECDFWDASAVSSVHGVIVSVVGFYVLFTQDALYTEGYKYETPEALLCMNIVVGYLISDLYLSLTHLEWPGTSMMLFHHLLGIFSMIYTTVHHYAAGTIVCMVVLEATSPFINFRWFFEKNGIKTTSPFLYLLNGAMITLSWFLLRICFYGWMIFNFVIRLWSDLMSYNSYLHTFVVVFGMLGGYALQIVWFKKIFAGMMKALTSSKKTV